MQELSKLCTATEQINIIFLDLKTKFMLDAYGIGKLNMYNKFD